MPEWNGRFGFGSTYSWEADGWDDQLEQLLYDGEVIESTVSLGRSRVLVTRQRVLVFTPDTDGENIRLVERPNATGVTTSATGNTAAVSTAIKLGVSGLILIAASLVFDPSGLLSTPDVGDAPGAGGALDLIQQMIGLLELLDAILLLGGGVLLLGTVGSLGYYVLTRDRVVRIVVAGGEDIHIPVAGDPATAASDLGTALDPTTSPTKRTTPSGDST